MSGQQKPIAIPVILVSLGEVITTTATITRVFATATVRPMPTATVPFAHFCTCNAGMSGMSEILCKVILKTLKKSKKVLL